MLYGSGKDNTRNKENKRDFLMTDQFGHVIPDNQNSLTVGSEGPVLLQDTFLHNKLSQFARERIPERAVHPKGAGAHGYFEVSSNFMSQYCKAKMFQPGVRTPLFTRFSTVTGDRGSADTIRDPRGMAIKFYTPEGIQDMVCLNFPIFFNKDGMKGPDVVHVLKRNPESGVFRDPNMYWDFFSQFPESIHAVTMLFSDRGTPYNYRHMSAWYGHTLKLVNEAGQACWCKIHFKPTIGCKNLTDDQASYIAGKDPDFATRDLYEYLAQGNKAEWKMMVQIIPWEDAWNYKYDLFDITKVVCKKDYPEVEVGTLTLDRNPSNYFAEVEQVAFLPSNMVPGIEPSYDRLLQARMFLYRDTQLHRLGPNYHMIPINHPSYMGQLSSQLKNMSPMYSRDGYQHIWFEKSKSEMAGNMYGVPVVPNYEPNTCPNAAMELPLLKEKGTPIPTGQSLLAPVRMAKQHKNDDYSQCRLLWREVFSEIDRTNLVNNIAKDLGRARNEIQIRMLNLFYNVDQEYGQRVAQALKLIVNAPPEKVIGMGPVEHQQYLKTSPI